MRIIPTKKPKCSNCQDERICIEEHSDPCRMWRPTLHMYCVDNKCRGYKQDRYECVRNNMIPCLFIRLELRSKRNFGRNGVLL